MSPGRAVDRRLLAGLVFGAVLAADQLSKSWAVGRLWMRPDVHVIDGWLHLSLHFNRGVAFGRAAGLPVWVVALPAVVVTMAIGWWLRRHDDRAVWTCGGIAAAGVLGNLLDRGLRHVPSFGAHTQTAVVDFIVVAPGRWPAFNVADVAICVGLFGLVLASQRAAAARRATV